MSLRQFAVGQPILAGLAALLFAAAVIPGGEICKTKITFSEAIRVPGVTLSAGTYYFKASERKNRALVRIEDENGKYVTQFMGIAEYTSQLDQAIITFADHDCGLKSVQSWSYPSTGLVVRFVYSKHDAALIADSCH